MEFLYVLSVGRHAMIVSVRIANATRRLPVRLSSYQSPRNSPVITIVPRRARSRSIARRGGAPAAAAGLDGRATARTSSSTHVMLASTALPHIYVGYTEQEAEGFHSHETSWKQLSQIACNCRHPTPNKSCLVCICAGLPRRLPRLGSAGTPPRPSASSTPPRRRPMGLLVAAEVGHHWDRKLLPSPRRIRSPSS